MTTKIGWEIRHTFCFQHILSLWWNLCGKSNYHQKTARRAWNQSEKRSRLSGILNDAPLCTKGMYLEEIRWAEFSGQVSHSRHTDVGIHSSPLSCTWLCSMPTTRCADMSFLRLCQFHGLGDRPVFPHLWLSCHPCLPSEAQKRTVILEWPSPTVCSVCLVLLRLGSHI